MVKTIGGETTAHARAHSNIALIKYWGKRERALNLPAVGSISITLDALSTDTWVTFDAGVPDPRMRRADTFILNGQPGEVGVDSRVWRVLERVRERAGLNASASVSSSNDFPTGAGLASSASGFAALAVAASHAAGLELHDRELSILARQGSGSAARSIFGGYVEMHVGSAADGSDAFAEPLLDAETWPLSVVVAITDHAAKSVSSGAGMGASSATSPFFGAWVERAEDDLAGMRAAIAARDFGALGELSEYSCLKLHALMLTTRPALIYWNAATVAAMHTVRRLRADGVPTYFTIDAGPQVKAVCAPADAATVAAALAAVPGVADVRVSGLGGAAQLVET
ncbi:diphosphomevalonate decarboxylase [Rathayibacter soli]|uniref:diphosphomevalonate decarboxylase n=1 Tax=Rathayibacter soli TaxID=3144168 RepID=UPI0027E579E8|nr:diphosphomevalonate decarboxylase [Glaciibacter superstes]